MQLIQPDKNIYYRLIALWVVCEAMLGGIIHGFKIPVSGLVVGSCAVSCICLIGYYYPLRGAILKATLIVAVFKMMLSPQAPFPAYIAVFFQGLTGEALINRRRFYRAGCVVFATLSLLESGLQRILVLTIIYGNDLWKIINDFFNKLAGQKTFTNYSLLIAGTYVLIHLVTGLLVGSWAGMLPSKISGWQSQKKYIIPASGKMTGDISPVKKTKKRSRIILFIIWILLIGLFLQSEFRIGPVLLPASLPLRILVRSFIIVLTWIFLVGPVLKQVLHGWLEKKKSHFQNDIQAVLRILPSTAELVKSSWKLSKTRTGIARLKYFGKIVLANSFREDAYEIIVITGPVRTGKTTSLQKWAGIHNTKGILTPVINEKRMFMDLNTGDLFPMEAGAGEENVLEVGRFRFSRSAFEKAIQIVRNSMEGEGWLIIDEIGPLELKGDGFADLLSELINYRRKNLMIVVREGILKEVQEKFGFTAREIRDPSEIN